MGNINGIFDPRDCQYDELIKEMRPVINRYLSHVDLNLSCFDLKIIERGLEKFDDDEEEVGFATFLVLDTQNSIWTFKYKFPHPERWEQHGIQASSVRLEANEFTALKASFLELHMSEEEADKAITHHYMEAPLCLQKEEAAETEEAKKKK